jgi:hypothetical protein
LCDPTYHIFRCGSILRADKPATAQTTVELGRKLEAASKDFTKAFLGFLSNTMKFKEVRLSSGRSGSPTRVRVHPAIIVDFPPVRFEFADLEVDARVCMTTWTGERKAKIWVRLSVTNPQSDKRVVSSFFRHAREVAPLLQDFAENYYSDLVRESFGIEVTNILGIYIRMVSSPSRAILQAVEDDRSPQGPTDRDKLLETVERVLRSEFDLDLGDPPEGTRRLVKSFQYPLNSMVAISEKAHVEPTMESLENLLSMNFSGYNDVQGLYAVDLGKTRAEVYGVAYEEQPPPRTFANAASQIASAELSYQLGGVY